jgi:hypothetical protein
MAGVRRTVVVVGLRLVACTSSVQPSSTAAAVDPASPSSTDSNVVVPGGPLAEPCQLGELSKNVELVSLSKLLANTGDYYGKHVRTRGYFILAFENISLVEPTKRTENVVLDVRKLPATDPQQLIACRLKFVNVQGYVTHVPVRGGERITIIADAMTSAP